MFSRISSFRARLAVSLVFVLLSVVFAALPVSADEPVTYYALGYQIVCRDANGNTTNDNSLAVSIAVLHPDFVDPILSALFSDVDTSGGNQVLDQAPGVYGGQLILSALAGGGYQLNGVDNTGKLDDYEFSGCNPLMDVSPASPEDDDNKKCNQFFDFIFLYEDCLADGEVCTVDLFFASSERCFPVYEDPSECEDPRPLSNYNPQFDDDELFFCNEDRKD